MEPVKLWSSVIAVVVVWMVWCEHGDDIKDVWRMAWEKLYARYPRLQMGIRKFWAWEYELILKILHFRIYI